MRILIIEDEKALAEAICQSLLRENYMVDVAYNGEDGLNQALTDLYDVIILDLMLPKINGLEILKLLRLEEIKTHIIILTAKGELDDKVKGLDKGADDYMTKPFHMRELIARIGVVARRKSDVLDNILTFGNISLNIKSCEIKNIENNLSLSLNGKEYTLIEFLFRNKKQVVNREQITERIWGYDNDSQYNNVEVYLSFIRKKLKFLESNIRIKAIRGIGYILEEIDD